MNNTNSQPTTQTQWPPQQTLTIQRTIQQPVDQRQVIWSQQSLVINHLFTIHHLFKNLIFLNKYYF